LDIAAPLLAGLGLFSIGLRLVSQHLKQLAGRRLRRLMAWALSGRGPVALFGLAAGAVMQSVNAVTFVLVALVTAGAIETRKAFAVINWANIGTSLLVVLAAINLHVAALVLVGLVGLAHYLNLDQSARYRHLVGALLGLCLLFLGIDFIKSGSVLLKSLPWLRDTLGASAGHSPAWAFVLGMAVALVAQSSSTVTVIAMAMASAGLLGFETGSLLVVGSGLGSGLSAWLLAGRLEGSARQLVLWQVLLRAAGVLLTVLLLALEAFSGWPLLRAGLQSWQLSPAGELAAVFLLLQLLSWLAVVLARPVLVRAVESWAPPSVQELLGKPRYIDDPVLVEEPSSALLLAEREQQHLLGFLPQFLNPLRPEARPGGPETPTLLAAQRQVLQACDHFLTELVDRHHNRDVQERSNVLRQRNELLGSLQDTLADLVQQCRPLVRHPQTQGLSHGMVEALHLMLETLAETAVGRHADDRAMLLQLTQDRSELMDEIRRRLLRAELELAQDLQHAALTATGLFERSVWLMRRYLLHLDLLPADDLA
jgi:phosphate:Na+ symporter